MHRPFSLVVIRVVGLVSLCLALIGALVPWWSASVAAQDATP